MQFPAGNYFSNSSAGWISLLAGFVSSDMEDPQFCSEPILGQHCREAAFAAFVSWFLIYSCLFLLSSRYAQLSCLAALCGAKSNDSGVAEPGLEASPGDYYLPMTNQAFIFSFIKWAPSPCNMAALRHSEERMQRNCFANCRNGTNVDCIFLNF